MNYGNTKNKKYLNRSNQQNFYDQFHATGFFLYPLKIPENQKFSYFSGRNRKRSLT